MRQAIILAGGLGTRLQGVGGPGPKPMATIANRPFLEYLLTSLARQEFTQVTLAVCHKWEMIAEHFGERFGPLEIRYSVEREPLGTGGGLRQAMAGVRPGELFVLNGDSFFGVNLADMEAFHRRTGSELTLAAREVPAPDRYGTVECSGSRILRFREKQPGLTHGTINAGIYLFDSALAGKLPEGRFSFEDYLVQNAAVLAMHAFKADPYFIDIGIPEDYRRAESELPALLGFGE